MPQQQELGNFGGWEIPEGPITLGPQTQAQAQQRVVDEIKEAKTDMPRGQSVQTLDNEVLLRVKRDKDGSVKPGFSLQRKWSQEDDYMRKELKRNPELMTATEYKKLFPDDAELLDRQIGSLKPKAGSKTIPPNYEIPLVTERPEPTGIETAGPPPGTAPSTFDDNFPDPRKALTLRDMAEQMIKSEVESKAAMLNKEVTPADYKKAELYTTKTLNESSSFEEFGQKLSDPASLTAADLDWVDQVNKPEDVAPSEDEGDDTLWKIIAGAVAAVAPALIGYSAYGTKGAWLGMQALGKGVAKGADYYQKGLKGEEDRDGVDGADYLPPVIKAEYELDSRGRPKARRHRRYLYRKGETEPASVTWLGHAPDSVSVDPKTGIRMTGLQAAQEAFDLANSLEASPDQVQPPKKTVRDTGGGRVATELPKGGSKKPQKPVYTVSKALEDKGLPSYNAGKYANWPMDGLSNPRRLVKANGKRETMAEVRERRKISDRITALDDLKVKGEINDSIAQAKEERVRGRQLADQDRAWEEKVEFWKKQEKRKDVVDWRNKKHSELKSSRLFLDFELMKMALMNSQAAVSEFAFLDGQGKKLTSEGAEDITLLYSYIKMIDPNSVVKEGEVKLGRSGIPMFDKIMNFKDLIMKGQLLPSDFRKSIKRIINRRFQLQLTAIAKAVNQYTDEATSKGIDPSMVIPSTAFAALQTYGRRDGEARIPSISTGDANNWTEKDISIYQTLDEGFMVYTGGVPYIMQNGELEPVFSDKSMNYLRGLGIQRLR